jgi:hypothetical protein
MRPCRPDPSLSAWSGLHHHPYNFSAHHPPGQLCLAFNDPNHRLSWDPHGDRAYYLGPALTHYFVTESMLSPHALNASPSPLHTFPSPSFILLRLTFPHFLSPTHHPTPPPHTRRHGLDRAGLQRPRPRSLPCCRGGATPSLDPRRGQPRPNRTPPPSRLGPHLVIHLAGWGHAHLFRLPSLRLWSGYNPWLLPTPPLPQSQCLPHPMYHPPFSRRQHHNASRRLSNNDAAAPAFKPLSPLRRPPPTSPPVYSPAPADLNLDGAGQPLSFSRYSRAAWQRVDACG